MVPTQGRRLRAQRVLYVCGYETFDEIVAVSSGHCPEAMANEFLESFILGTPFHTSHLINTNFPEVLHFFRTLP